MRWCFGVVTHHDAYRYKGVRKFLRSSNMYSIGESVMQSVISRGGVSAPPALRPAPPLPVPNTYRLTSLGLPVNIASVKL